MASGMRKKKSPRRREHGPHGGEGGGRLSWGRPGFMLFPSMLTEQKSRAVWDCTDVDEERVRGGSLSIREESESGAVRGFIRMGFIC